MFFLIYKGLLGPHLHRKVYLPVGSLPEVFVTTPAHCLVFGSKVYEPQMFHLEKNTDANAKADVKLLKWNRKVKIKGNVNLTVDINGFIRN